MNNCTNIDTSELKDIECCQESEPKEYTVKGKFIYCNGKKFAKVIEYLGGIDAKPHLDDMYKIEMISKNKYINGTEGTIQVI